MIGRYMDKAVRPDGPPRPDRIRALAGPALIGLTIVVSALVYVGIAEEMRLTSRWVASDFLVFWTAADAPAPYDIEAITAAQQWYAGGDAARPFPYPPSFLPWLSPLTLLAMLPAYLVWTALTASLFLTVWSRLVPSRALLFGMAAPTVVLAAIPGQVVFLMGALVAGGLGLLARRPLLAGILFGTAATIKPQTLILVPLALAAGRHWSALLSAALSGAAILGACATFQGVDLWLDWLASLPQFVAVLRETGVMHAGITPASALALIGVDGPTALAVRLCAAAAGVATAWIVFRGTRDVALRMIGLNVATLMALPYAMPYELALSAPAAAMLLLDRRHHPIAAFAAFMILTTAGEALLLPLSCAMLIWMIRSGRAQPTTGPGADPASES